MPCGRAAADFRLGPADVSRRGWSVVCLFVCRGLVPVCVCLSVAWLCLFVVSVCFPHGGHLWCLFVLCLDIMCAEGWADSSAMAAHLSSDSSFASRVGSVGYLSR